MAKKSKKIIKTKKTRKGRRVDISTLLKKGKKQGFVTQEEILAIFPDAEDRVEELDELYDQLINKEIDVYNEAASFGFVDVLSEEEKQSFSEDFDPKMME